MVAVAALYVETGGCYFGISAVDPWDFRRDARQYRGTMPIVAHPPCERWGRYWHGSPRKPHQYKLGDDNGCFRAAYLSVSRCGGVIEHPAYTHAWAAHGITAPDSAGGWKQIGRFRWTCHVEQGHYGHMARKATWLYFVGPKRPFDLIWGVSPQRLSPIALERHGYEKARRTGVMAYIGGGKKKDIRARTPPAFRDVLLLLAQSVKNGP